MAATRAALNSPSPRAPGSRSTPAPSRPDLRVVPEPRPTGAIIAVALVVVFGVLLVTAALNTMLVGGQRDLDRLETQIREGEQRNRSLALEVAELESPERIKQAALADGMIEPEVVTWVTPQPDGTSDAVTAPTGGAEAQVDDGGGAGDDAGDETAADERADGGPDGSAG